MLNTLYGVHQVKMYLHVNATKHQQSELQETRKEILLLFFQSSNSTEYCLYFA
jgi:hypothetical protein